MKNSIIEKMNRISKIGTVILALSWVSSSARADVDLVVTSLKGASASDIQKIKAHALVKKSEPVFDAGERQALASMGQENMARAIKITVDSEDRAKELQAWAQRQGFKVKLEKNSLAFTLEVPPQSQSATDRFYGRQWALENTGQVEMLAVDDLTSVRVTGVPGEDIGLKNAPPENLDPAHRITVAVLDTGIDYSHPDLQDRVVEKPAECKALVEYTKCQKNAKDTEARMACDKTYSQMDLDGNGYPLDCSGWNTTVKKSVPGSTVWGDANAADDNGHGTHVSGIIAAAANGIGVRGVMRNVRILPVRVISASPSEPVRPSEVGAITNRPGNGSSNNLPSPDEKDLKSAKGFGDLIARGLLYAIRSGAQVINMSLGWPADVESNLMRQMIELARTKNILVVAAAGNDSTDALIRPCVYTGVICVGSHDPNGAMSNFSNYGSGVDIAAPGMNILSTFPLNKLSVQFTESVGYEIKSGTSMASPYVAGVLARILNAGVPPQEAYARLMAGARTQKPSTIRSKVQAPMYTLAGNADLAGALKAQPQPVILPVEKTPLAVLWNRSDREVAFSIPLKNYWSNSGRVRVDARLLTRGLPSTDAQLSRSSWTFDSWEGQETKRLETSLIINDRRLESELKIELTVSPEGFAPRSFAVQADVRVPLSRIVNDPLIRTIPISGAESIKGSNLRTVTALDEKPGQDYIAIEQTPNEWKLSLIKDQRSAHYEVAAETRLAAPKGELLLLHRLDLDNDGSSDYALIFRLPPTPEKKQPSFLFQMFDSQLKPLARSFGGQTSASIEYGNTVTVIPDRFQWMSLNGGRVPAWVSRGTTPDLEQPKYDPWNPSPLDAPNYRFYYLAQDGLRTIEVPEDYAIIATLNLTPEQRVRGAIPVLFAKGVGTEMEYAVAEALDGQFKGFRSVGLGRFRALRGVDLREVTSLSPGLGFTGTMFTTDSYRGAQRMTALIDRPEKPGLVDQILDQTLTSASEIDSVTKVAAVYLGERRSGVIQQTIYDLQYIDLNTKEAAATSLRRFSFLPGFFFFNIFYPAVLEDSNAHRGADRLPGVYVPSGLGLTQGLEVIVPRYANDGRLEGLVRPARLRLDAAAGCEALGNALPATEESPTQVMFYCGDHFVKVPLEY